MKKSKKSFIINILIILIILGIVLYFSLKDDYETIINSILNMNVLWIILAIILFCLYRILSGLSTYQLAKVNKEKIGILRCIQISFIIIFFHGVTPFAGGGQPMEIYYLHNEKISITKSTNIVLQNFIVYQISLVLIGLLALFYNYNFNLFPSNHLIKKLVILGFAINFLVLLVTYILSFGKKANKFICNKGLNIVEKLKIIKNVDKKRKNLNNYLNNFHKNAIRLKQNKKMFIILILINSLSLIILYSIPYTVCKGFEIHNLNLINSIVSTAYVMTIGSFVPIPGGTGGIEYGFVFFFGYLITGSVINAIMLVWRFITYYLGMIIGAICLALYRKKEKV
jgi:hypothetical protein